MVEKNYTNATIQNKKINPQPKIEVSINPKKLVKRKATTTNSKLLDNKIY